MKILRQPPIRLLLGVIFFAALLAIVEIYIGWRALFAPWQMLRPDQVALAAGLVLVSYAIRTLRLVYFFPMELRKKFLPSFKLMLIHNIWNNLLPMRTGEISFPILMQSYFSIEAHRSLPALLWFRLLDLYAVFMLAVVSLASIGGDFTRALEVAILLGILIPFTWKLMPVALLRLEKLNLARTGPIAAKIRQSLPASWRLLAISAGWTLINWAVKLAVFAWIFSQFIKIDFGLALLGAIGGEITSVLPLHGIAGAGTYEAGIVSMLLPAQVLPRQSLMAAVNLHIFVLSCATLGGIVGYLLPRRVGLADPSISG